MHPVELPRWPSLPPLTPAQRAQATAPPQGDAPPGTLRLGPGDDVRALDLTNIDGILFVFQKFADGRPFSQARRLREQRGFEGALIAGGDVLPDQAPFLARCGFDIALMADARGVEVARAALEAFDAHYQPTGDGRPLIRHIGGTRQDRGTGPQPRSGS